MAPKKNTGDDGYRQLAESIKADQIGRFYIFHGVERYLLQSSLDAIRDKLCPGGLAGFNYKRFEGSGINAQELEDAVSVLPLMAERTLVELFDYDLFRSEQKEMLVELLSDLPPHVCVIAVYDTVPYNPDRRKKDNAAIMGFAEVVEFTVQDEKKLADWIARHFRGAGKRISVSDATYLARITGGLMYSLTGEIGKVAAYSSGETISRSDIDAVVTPVIDTYIYRLTNALASRNYAAAADTLDELLRLREAPHKILFSISLKARQLLAARVCIDSGAKKSDLIEMCSIRNDFQADELMRTARKMTLPQASRSVLLCADAALEMNSGSDQESSLIELLARLAIACKA